MSIVIQVRTSLPILKISLQPDKVKREAIEREPACRFAELANVNESMVTVVTNKMTNCFGNEYSAIAHLYLPDLWSSRKINEMQLASAHL